MGRGQSGSYSREKIFCTRSARPGSVSSRVSRAWRMRATRGSAAAAPAVRDDLARRFREFGFRFVTLDLEGFRSGSLNDLVGLEVKARYAPRPPAAIPEVSP